MRHKRTMPHLIIWHMYCYPNRFKGGRHDKSLLNWTRPDGMPDYEATTKVYYTDQGMAVFRVMCWGKDKVMGWHWSTGIKKRRKYG